MTRPRPAHPTDTRESATPPAPSLRVTVPWWSHPTWVVLLLPLPLALLAIVAGRTAYEQWEVPKYLTLDLSTILLIGIAALVLGMVFGSARSLGVNGSYVTATPWAKEFVRTAFRTFLTLTILGYLFWIVSAAARGVNLNDLMEVISLEPGAISGLKDDATPIGGVTTLTQFGPLAVATGYLAKRMGAHVRGIGIVLVLAAVRALFYAERLAIIEVVVPLVLVWAFTLSTSAGQSGWRRVLPLAPLVAAPTLWALFAALEYTRSWIYYSRFTSLPYAEWVTNRLVGYYTTSYNNSALLATAASDVGLYPYFSVRFFWDAPVISSIATPPAIQGSTPGSWWYAVLQRMGNPNFNNYGSFLTSYAEFGFVGMVAIWTCVGLAIGSIYATMRLGNPIALITYSVIFVGILELPRFVYWTQGRAFPIIIGCIVLAFAYSGTKRRETARSRYSPQTASTESRKT